MTRNRVGFLPLYLKLYDDTCGFMRKRIEEFNTLIQNKLEDLGIEIVAAPICRVADEFVQAVSLFDDVCAVITLHLAYSPSLESIDALAKIKQPIIVLDTTPAFSFDQTTSDEEILYNHGIHGVQDMCNMLKRHGKQYFIEAGHWEKSDVINRVVELCKVAYSAHIMKTGRVGIVGEPFKGMGDFSISFDQLKDSIGTQVIGFDMSQVEVMKSKITEQEVENEIKDDLESFFCTKSDHSIHSRTARMNLLIRKWIQENHLDAYTLNFANIEKRTGFECVPFIEACKAMSRGIGFAGEGDVLTAILCGALLKAFPQSSFTEMFCPDWHGNSIFLSHMGEMNIRIAKGKMRLIEKQYPYTDVDNPYVVYGRFMPGDAVLVDLAPLRDEEYGLILSEISVLDINGMDMMEDSIHGWIRPKNMQVSEFLKQYSLAGGTHHLVIVYGDVLEPLKAFGRMMGFNVEVI